MYSVDLLAYGRIFMSISNENNVLLNIKYAFQFLQSNNVDTDFTEWDSTIKKCVASLCSTTEFILHMFFFCLMEIEILAL